MIMTDEEICRDFKQAKSKKRLYAKKKCNACSKSLEKERVIQCIANVCINRIDFQNSFMEVGISKASGFFIDFTNLCRKYDLTAKDIKFLSKFTMKFAEELKIIL